MRSHNNEHSDSLPVIDIASLRHVAYVFDALIYYMRSGTDTDTDVLRDGISVISWQDHDENENDDHDDDLNNAMSMDTESIDGDSEMTGKQGRKHPFFQRSDSTLFLGCPPPDPFETPLVQALPLADQPHLLQPNARREDLFGVAKQAVVPHATVDDKTVPGSENVLDKLPLHLSLSVRVPEAQSGSSGKLQTDSQSNVTGGNNDGHSTVGASVIVRSASYQPAPVWDSGDPSISSPFFPSAYESSVPATRPVSQSEPSGVQSASSTSTPTVRSIYPVVNISLMPQVSTERAEVHHSSVIVHSSTAISANVSAANMSSASMDSSQMSASSPIFNVTDSLPSDLRTTAVNIPLTSESVITSAPSPSRAPLSTPVIIQPSGTGQSSPGAVHTVSPVSMVTPPVAADNNQSLNAAVITARQAQSRNPRETGNHLFSCFNKSRVMCLNQIKLHFSDLQV